MAYPANKDKKKLIKTQSKVVSVRVFLLYFNTARQANHAHQIEAQTGRWLTSPAKCPQQLISDRKLQSRHKASPVVI